LLAIATAGALAHVGVRFKGMEVAYALGRERRVSGELEEQRRRLQIEIGMLKDPNRVVSIARDRLGMGPPAPEAIRRLGTGTLFVGPGAEPTNTNATAPPPGPASGAARGAGRAAGSGTTTSNRGAR
jgi:cell division protein FtsL